MFKKPSPPTIAQPYALGFLTDYGHADAYAGILHAVALNRLSPEARARTQCFDITHGIVPQDIRAGAWSLMQTLPYLPAHCAVVAVVDPFVGDAAQAVEVLYRPSYEQVFVAPSNGLLAPVIMLFPDVQRFVLTLDEAKAYGWPYLNEAQEVSAGNTFHGRDIYTPLVAHLLNQWMQGVAPDAVLEGYRSSVRTRGDVSTALDMTLPLLPWPVAKKEDYAIYGHVLLQDHFGNVITNIPRHWMEQPLTPSPLGGGLGLGETKQQKQETTLCITLGETPLDPIPLVSHYAAGKAHECFALFGSHGYLELASFGQPFPHRVERDMQVEIRYTG
jgi:S-adenosyl-L-methionine hydrolase (adenosine-forming)